MSETHGENPAPEPEREQTRVRNVIADVFTNEDDWQPLSTRYRLASAVVEALLHHGYQIVPTTTTTAGQQTASGNS